VKDVNSRFTLGSGVETAYGRNGSVVVWCGFPLTAEDQRQLGDEAFLWRRHFEDQRFQTEHCRENMVRLVVVIEARIVVNQQ
jgi:hypothetical protein